MNAPAADRSARPKLIYLAERNPALDRAGFTARWRRHGSLGMSLPRWRNVARYVQCDPLPELAGTSGCDGVALVWYHSEATRLRHVSDRDAREVMQRDEAETSARPVREFSVLTEEDTVIPEPDGPLKLFLVLRRAAACPPETFAAAWRGHAAMLAARLATVPGGAGYRRNATRPDSRGIGLGLDCDGIEEISFAERGLDGARALADWAVRHSPLATVAGIAPLWTSAVVLHDAGDGRSGIDPAG
jgi:hypothetical protein